MGTEKICISKQSIFMLVVGVISISFSLYTNNFAAKNKQILGTKAEVHRDAPVQWTFARSRWGGIDCIRAVRTPELDAVTLVYIDKEDQVRIEKTGLELDDAGERGYIVPDEGVRKFAFGDKQITAENMRIAETLKGAFAVSGERLDAGYTPWVLNLHANP